MKTRIQTKEFTIATSTGASITDLDTISLDTAYKKCIGVQLVEKVNTTPEEYDVRLSDNNQTYVDIQDKDCLVSSTGVAPSERYLDVEFEVSSAPITVAVKPRATTAATVTFQLLFKLVQE